MNEFMKKEDYPRFTIIMRGYTKEQATEIVRAASDFGKHFAVEVTLNTPNALDIINDLNEKFGNLIAIGAGTVRTLAEAKAAVSKGAKFLLGPHTFSKDMIDYCHSKEVVTIPAAMTPSEINQMLVAGADIIKIFPAAVVTPRFFKDVQAPLGKLPLMAVGGVSTLNAQEYLDNGASYLGMGSKMFDAEVLETLDQSGLKKTYRKLIQLH